MSDVYSFSLRYDFILYKKDQCAANCKECLRHSNGKGKRLGSKGKKSATETASVLPLKGWTLLIFFINRS